MTKLLLLAATLPLVAACVTKTYEKETVVEPRGSTSTVIVPQSSPPPARDTTIVVPR